MWSEITPLARQSALRWVAAVKLVHSVCFQFENLIPVLPLPRVCLSPCSKQYSLNVVTSVLAIVAGAFLAAG